MSVSIANLFNYSRALPEPFDSLTSKKVKVASKYGDSFLDITDLHQLPVKLTAVVKRHIRA